MLAGVQHTAAPSFPVWFLSSDLGFLSEVLAAEAVSCLNKALIHLKDIWEEIGIPEDQRLQRTNVVKGHIKVGSPDPHHLVPGFGEAGGGG